MRMELRLSWTKLAAVAMFAGAIIAPLSVAMAAQQGADVKVDLSLKDADIRDVCRECLVRKNRRTIRGRAKVRFLIKRSR